MRANTYNYATTLPESSVRQCVRLYTRVSPGTKTVPFAECAAEGMANDTAEGEAAAAGTGAVRTNSPAFTTAPDATDGDDGPANEAQSQPPPRVAEPAPAPQSQNIHTNVESSRAQGRRGEFYAGEAPRANPGERCRARGRAADAALADQRIKGLLSYKKWWKLRPVDISVRGQILSGTPIFDHENTLRVVNGSYSYFIPMANIDYIRTPDGLRGLSELDGAFSGG